jgi:hypothetical protein
MTITRDQLKKFSRALPWIFATGAVIVGLKMMGVQLRESASPVLPSGAKTMAHKKVTPAPVESHEVDISLSPIDEDAPDSRLLHHGRLMNGHTPDRMNLTALQRLHTYNYVFEGAVTQHRKPCAEASVLVRLNTASANYVQGAVTDENGAYSIKMSVQAAPDEAIDYSMEAHDSNFNKVELVSRRIISREQEEVVMVQKPIDIAIARLPK